MMVLMNLLQAATVLILFKMSWNSEKELNLNKIVKVTKAQIIHFCHCRDMTSFDMRKRHDVQANR